MKYIVLTSLLIYDLSSNIQIAPYLSKKSLIACADFHDTCNVCLHAFIDVQSYITRNYIAIQELNFEG